MPRANVYTAHGGPEVAGFAELPPVAPGAGQLLVAVRAAGVNPVDWKRRSGWFGDEEFPVVLGSEVAGVVTQVGPGVTGFAPGDAVFGSPVGGGYAQYTLLAAQGTAHKPEGLTFTDAATLPVAAATAYDGVRHLALPAGATLLVNGVGGGVGVAAAQIARHEGLTVVGTASPAKRELAESLGVRHVASGPGVAERIAAVAPDGVDGILDLVGGDALEAVAGALADRTRLVTAADPARAGALGGTMVRRARSAEVLDAVARLVVEGALLPHVTNVFPFEEAARALAAVEEGHAVGKTVIEVAA